MSAEPALVSTPPTPPSIAPLELARLRGSVRAGLFEVPQTPPRVGRYELLRCIGRGGMGIVYLARDVELSRQVAIKLLRPELSTPGDGRLTSEARALAQLSHPNVIGVFDVGTHEGQRFIAMEYVPGVNLRCWLESPRTLRELLHVFVGAGRGLHAAHEVGLVHRDFKPDNVLVGEDGRPRVLDFGLARPPDGSAQPGGPPSLPAGIDPLATMLTGVGQVLGTPAYMAPEQHLGESADARSDQFSFGVALYHAVYGVRPFSGDDPQALALSIVRGRVRPASPRYPVPPWLDELLERTLAVDPAHRFESMDVLLMVIEQRLAKSPDQYDVAPVRAVVDELAGRGGVVAGLGTDSLGLLGLAPTMLAESSPQALAVPAAAGSTDLARPPEEEIAGIPTSVSTRRTLEGPVGDETLAIMVRELDRLEGRKGKAERLGTSLAWSTGDLEVHVDVTDRGTELLVWRKLNRKLRRRTFSWMALGFWLSTMFIAAVEGSELLRQIAVAEIAPLFIIGSLIGGTAMGHRKGRQRHIRSIPGERAQLEFIAERLVTLSRATSPLALGDGR